MNYGILRMAIIDDDLKRIRKIERKNNIEDIDITYFCRKNDDICFIFNEENTELEHEKIMREFLRKFKFDHNIISAITGKFYSELLSKTKPNQTMKIHLFIKLLTDMAYNKFNKISPVYKTMIINKLSELVEFDQFSELFELYLEKGGIDDCLIKNYKEHVDFFELSKNKDIKTPTLLLFDEEDLDWASISLRNLSSIQILKYKDKLVMELQILYNKDNLINAIMKSEELYKMIKEYYIKIENYPEKEKLTNQLLFESDYQHSHQLPKPENYYNFSTNFIKENIDVGLFDKKIINKYYSNL